MSSVISLLQSTSKTQSIHSFRNMCFSLRLCSMLEDKLGVDLPKQGFGLPMRWRRRSKKSKYFGAPLTDHDGNLSAFNGTRQWQQSWELSCLLWDFRNIPEIFLKYPRNIREILRICQKKCRELCCLFCDAQLQGGISKAPLAGRPHSFTFQHQYWTRGLSTWSRHVLCIYI